MLAENCACAGCALNASSGAPASKEAMRRLPRKWRMTDLAMTAERSGGDNARGMERVPLLGRPIAPMLQCKRGARDLILRDPHIGPIRYLAGRIKVLFEDRERGYEAKWAHDAETLYRIRVRREARLG